MNDSPGKRISVIGAGVCGEETYEQARRLGRLLARKGHTIVCGGLGGVMTAVCQGAREENGRTIGVLPGLDLAAANPYVEIPIATGLGHMRNFLVVQNGDLAVAVEGETGTLSEAALALKSGKTVIALGRWSGLPGVIPAADVDEAVRLVDEHLK